MKNNTFWKIAGIGVVLSVLAIYTSSAAALNGLIGSSLRVGSTGPEVTTLQSFLANSHDIYPRGLVTGYYGPLTQAAIKQLQVAYGIVGEDGILGPVTLALVNRIMASGLSLDIASPYFYNLTVQTGSNNATLNWSTNELSRTKIYYDTRPLLAYETTRNFQEPTITGLVAADDNYNLIHSTNLINLQPQTTYYYIIEATDKSGNLSVTTQGTFRTN